MDFKVPVALATVAYRFYLATHEYMIESILDEADCLGERYHEIKLEVNSDTPQHVSVYYMLDVDDDDRLELYFCMEFSPEFERKWVIFDESSRETMNPENMRTILKDLSEQTIRLSL